MDPLPTVRVGTLEDETQILDLCSMIHEEIGLFPLDINRVRSVVIPALRRDGAIIGVIGERGKLEGCILLSVEDHWYSRQGRHLLELFNFVHPDYRCPPGRAKALIEFSKKCADDLHLPLLIGVLCNKRTEAKVRLYQRQLTQAGAFFIYNKAAAAQGDTGDVRRG